MQRIPKFLIKNVSFYLHPEPVSAAVLWRINKKEILTDSVVLFKNHS